jgi:hypothetical protein
MKSTVGAATLLLISAAFLGVGWLGLTDPRAVLGPVGFSLGNATAMNEARANYGGMHVTMGLFFLCGVFVGGVRGVALSVALLFLGGLVVGRGVSISLDGPPEAPLAWGLLAVEAVGVLLVLSALLKRRRVARQPIRKAPPPGAPVVAGEGTPAG